MFGEGLLTSPKRLTAGLQSRGVRVDLRSAGVRGRETRAQLTGLIDFTNCRTENAPLEPISLSFFRAAEYLKPVWGSLASVTPLRGYPGGS